MTRGTDYHVQFFRQWLGDSEIEDLPATGPLDHVKALAQTTLEALARDWTAGGRPRIARIVDPDSRAIVAEFRLTQDGPVEVALRQTPTPRTAYGADHGPALRVIDGAGPARDADR